MKFTPLFSAAAATLLIAPTQASLLAIDFNNTNNSAWIVTGAAGPLGNTNWNRTSTASSVAPLALSDDAGNPTTATLSWSSSNHWTNGDGNGTEDTKLAHAYLDDGEGGASITIESIPYTRYTVYGLIASGQNSHTNTYTTLDFQINGTDWVIGSIIDGDAGTSNNTATAHGGVGSAGGGWDEILGDGAGNQTQVGNYWIWEGGNTPTLTVNGQQRDGNSRGSITGLIIQEVVVPEPGSLALLLIGAGCVARRLRRS